MDDRFVKETEVEAAKRKRQEEWEKARKPEDPKEAPEEPEDRRPLWAKLQEQKDKKDQEYKDEHALKNSIRGLENDEIQFLDQVEVIKRKRKLEQKQEEIELIEELRKKAATEALDVPSTSATELTTTVATAAARPKPKAPGPAASKVNKQAALLGVAIKRKSRASESSTDAPPAKTGAAEENTVNGVVPKKDVLVIPAGKQPSLVQTAARLPAMTQPAARLPALIGYGGGEHSDSDDSSDSQSDSDGNVDNFENQTVDQLAAGKRKSTTKSVDQNKSLNSSSRCSGGGGEGCGH